MAGMRDMLIHDYMGVDLTTVANARVARLRQLARYKKWEVYK